MPGGGITAWRFSGAVLCVRCDREFCGGSQTYTTMLSISPDGKILSLAEMGDDVQQTVTKRCPFCERSNMTVEWEEAEPLTAGDNSTHLFWIECGCGARGPISRTPEVAVALWDGRDVDDQ